ncbi:hypothetical protein NQ176_g9844 [Zarea fungicola]|uniref:Uncharacterized protein n=1 Tax=Zarea fungicola TaxID=93591 RepID=A0ACC1MLB7_9HYPO|nr:hypothetical protein NQ176_g9844 [Lecanicillium fungicola]
MSSTAVQQTGSAASARKQQSSSSCEVDAPTTTASSILTPVSRRFHPQGPPRQPHPTRKRMWYYYAFLTPRGAAGLASDPRGWARTVWQKNSVARPIDEAYFNRTAAAFNNPDYVDLVLNFYRNRLLYAPGAAEYAGLAAELDGQPKITVPSVTLDPAEDLVLPPKNASATASFFTNKRCHHIVRGSGHDIPHDAPQAFAKAIMEVDTLAQNPDYVCPVDL